MSWPDDFSAPALHRLIDVQAILRLEAGGRAQIDAWQAHQWKIQRDWLMAHVPWWRERLHAATDWLQPGAWPVLSRLDLQALVDRHGAAPVPPTHGDLQPGATSGSTGWPVRYFISAYAQRLVSHSYFADHARHARDPFALRAVIDERSSHPPDTTHTARPADVVEGTGPVLLRNAVRFGMDEHVAWLATHAPTHLTCLPWWLDAMLDAVEAGGAGAPAPRLDQVLTYGGNVTPHMRERAHALLGARIVDRYSSKECGPLAFQCPASDHHYHVAVDNLRLEVVDAEGAACAEGVTGRVLVTTLHNYATPLVRYDIGDVAALHARCPGCGADLPALSNLLGRRMFLLRRPRGGLISAMVPGKNWLACAPVREHRLVQTAVDEVVAEVVLERPLTDEEAAAIVRMLRETLDEDLRFVVRQLDSIPKPPGQKPQTAISLVP